MPRLARVENGKGAARDPCVALPETCGTPTALLHRAATCAAVCVSRSFVLVGMVVWCVCVCVCGARVCVCVCVCVRACVRACVLRAAVGNHMGPVDFSQLYPFNQSDHYHGTPQQHCEAGGTDQHTLETCWLVNLPDLAQENEFVTKGLVAWMSQLQDTYGFDGTTPFEPWHTICLTHTCCFYAVVSLLRWIFPYKCCIILFKLMKFFCVNNVEQASASTRCPTSTSSSGRR